MEMEVGVWGNRTEVVAEVEGAGGGSGQVGRGGMPRAGRARATTTFDGARRRGSDVYEDGE